MSSAVLRAFEAELSAADVGEALLESTRTALQFYLRRGWRYHAAVRAEGRLLLTKTLA